MDFADALHLGRSEPCEAFMTFDGPMVKRAMVLGIEKVKRL
jgi:hypothetical protein